MLCNECIYTVYIWEPENANQIACDEQNCLYGTDVVTRPVQIFAGNSTLYNGVQHNYGNTIEQVALGLLHDYSYAAATFTYTLNVSKC